MGEVRTDGQGVPRREGVRGLEEVVAVLQSGHENGHGTDTVDTECVLVWLRMLLTRCRVQTRAERGTAVAERQ